MDTPQLNLCEHALHRIVASDLRASRILAPSAGPQLRADDPVSSRTGIRAWIRPASLGWPRS